MKTWRPSIRRGQTALETAFVLSSILFVTFTLVNFAILFHTKSIATYAAFMAGRSYQVVGDQTNADFFKEETGQNFLGQTGGGHLFDDLKGTSGDPTLAVVRAAEDIFTCALPWISVPGDDAQDSFQNDADAMKKSFSERCMEGKRKYQKLNIGKSLRFLPFDRSSGNDVSKFKNLELVKGGFSEQGRDPLRYGILNMKYRTPLIFNPMGSFISENDSPFIKDEVFVPVLINPGLRTGLQDNRNSNEQDFDDEK